MENDGDQTFVPPARKDTKHADNSQIGEVWGEEYNVSQCQLQETHRLLNYGETNTQCRLPSIDTTSYDSSVSKDIQNHVLSSTVRTSSTCNTFQVAHDLSFISPPLLDQSKSTDISIPIVERTCKMKCTDVPSSSLINLPFSPTPNMTKSSCSSFTFQPRLNLQPTDIAFAKPLPTKIQNEMTCSFDSSIQRFNKASHSATSDPHANATRCPSDTGFDKLSSIFHSFQKTFGGRFPNGDTCSEDSASSRAYSARLHYLEALNNRLKERISSNLSYEQQLEIIRPSRASFDALNGPFMDARGMHKHFMSVATNVNYSHSPTGCSSDLYPKPDDKSVLKPDDTVFPKPDDTVLEEQDHHQSTAYRDPCRDSANELSALETNSCSSLQVESSISGAPVDFEDLPVRRLCPAEVSGSSDSSGSFGGTFTLNSQSRSKRRRGFQNDKSASDPGETRSIYSDHAESPSRRKKEGEKVARRRKRRPACKPSEGARMSKQNRRKKELEYLTELTALRIEHEDLQRKYNELQMKSKRLESHIRSNIRKWDCPTEYGKELSQTTSETSSSICVATESA